MCSIRPNIDAEDHRRVGNEYQNITIEMAIFVDKSLYQALKKTFSDNTDEHVVNVVTAMMNAVQILFDDKALGKDL